jgi:hypothetical protein
LPVKNSPAAIDHLAEIRTAESISAEFQRNNYTQNPENEHRGLAQMVRSKAHLRSISAFRNLL